MKIVYLSPSGELGGAEKSLIDILASLSAARPDWTLSLVAGEDGPLLSKVKSLNIAATVIPFPLALSRLGDAGVRRPGRNQSGAFSLLVKGAPAGLSIVTYVMRLRRELRKLAPDVLHTNGFKMHILGAWSRPRETSLVWHIHDYVSTRPVMTRLLRGYRSRCSAAIANSNSVADDVRAVCNGRMKVHPVYNAVDLDRFSPTGSKSNLDALAGLPQAPPGTLRVGLLATFGRWKGHAVFFKALSLLPSSMQFRGYVIGAALYKTAGSQYSLEELRQMSSQLGVSHKVGFTGFVEDTASAIRSLDVVVHTSTEPEPFGLVIVEAMACGRAVIVSRAGGAAEIIDEGTNALGHHPGDAEGLAERIEQLAKDIDLRKSLARAGRSWTEQHFNRARLATDLIPIYCEAASLNN